MGSDTEKVTNLRANALPVDGFVLSVDGKLKTRYETSEEAISAGLKLKQNFPAIMIEIFDAVGRTYKPLEMPQS
jgi:hypothetical protein